MKYLACLFVLAFGYSLGSAQELQKTVAAGVYTEAQADRGALTYNASCGNCHRLDLTGGNGPALVGERFAHIFAGKDLDTLFSKISTTMPRGDAGSLGDDVYLDVVAHVLRENGFPAGSRELELSDLKEIQVLQGKPKPPPPIGDFSYVEVVGCLSAGPQNSWMLTRSSDPVALVPTATSGAKPPSAGTPLGTQTFHLLDAMAYAPETHKGHRMYVRGLLVRSADGQRIAISAFEMLSSTCRE